MLPPLARPLRLVVSVLLSAFSPHERPHRHVEVNRRRGRFVLSSTRRVHPKTNAATVCKAYETALTLLRWKTVVLGVIPISVRPRQTRPSIDRRPILFIVNLLPACGR